MTQQYFIGLMSGTSLDGVDAILVGFSGSPGQTVATHYEPYSTDLKQSLLALHSPQENELAMALEHANQIATLYAKAVNQLIAKTNISHAQVCAIGAHGQTIRHVPESAYTCQLLNSARLAELTTINVISDFRSRDIAAGGQGAPLVPAFHKAVFADQHINRAVINIGGIANVTYLPTDQHIIGFDTGPGNLLLDYWCQRNTNQAYDKGGAWARSGVMIDTLLSSLIADPYFLLAPPKSTGRDLFNADWLAQHLLYPQHKPEDIARTLVEFSAYTIVKQTEQYCANVAEIYLCGGGVHNDFLVERISALSNSRVETTDQLGIAADWVEAYAFAWLAQQFIKRQTGNIPSVTGAARPCILGTMTLA